MKLRKVFLFTMAALGALNGLAFANDSYQSTMKKDQAAVKMVPHAAITFAKGSSVLTETDTAALRKFVQNAQSMGVINEITVAAWSDKMLPAKGQRLLDTDRDLASNRAQAIENFLKKDLMVSSVATYSMAENANWLARTFNTRDAELKSVFARTGSDMPVGREEFQAIKNEGGPSKAIAVIKFKPEKVAPFSPSTMSP